MWNVPVLINGSGLGYVWSPLHLSRALSTASSSLLSSTPFPHIISFSLSLFLTAWGHAPSPPPSICNAVYSARQAVIAGKGRWLPKRAQLIFPSLSPPPSLSPYPSISITTVCTMAQKRLSVHYITSICFKSSLVKAPTCCSIVHFKQQFYKWQCCAVGSMWCVESLNQPS